MKKYSGMPELLEQYMEEQGVRERWVTVQELRDRFGLSRYQCNTVSGFLRRLEYSTFGKCPYIVMRIEHQEESSPSRPAVSRYLVQRKDPSPYVYAQTRENSGSATGPVFQHALPVTTRLKIESGK
jgi:hypothetical protein